MPPKIHKAPDGAVVEYRFGEIQRLSNQLANLLAERGAAAGDRIAVLLPQAPETAYGHVAIAKQRLKTTVPWLCDSMDNQIQHALEAAPNGEFVVDAAGKIVRKRFWHDPTKLREFLVELVGPVDQPTAVADKHLLLIDDVATTCATGNACAEALLAAGAASVTLLTFARA